MLQADSVAWSLAPVVCVFVSTVSPAKAAEPIEMFLGADLLGPEEPYKTGPDPPQEMTLEGEGTLDATNTTQQEQHPQ